LEFYQPIVQDCVGSCTADTSSHELQWWWLHRCNWPASRQHTQSKAHLEAATTTASPVAH
jgi:hypothetical protein